MDNSGEAFVEYSNLLGHVELDRDLFFSDFVLFDQIIGDQQTDACPYRSFCSVSSTEGIGQHWRPAGAPYFDCQCMPVLILGDWQPSPYGILS